MKNLLFAQSGGPTAVFNASAAGVISAAQKSGRFGKILCAAFGMDGILSEDFFDVTDLSQDDLELLAATPASAFGSCRFKLPQQENDNGIFGKIAAIFDKYNVGCFVYNGGNDSMDSCLKIADYLAKIGQDCKVVGVPKTVDNDLVGTHHCPGYGSAAKFVATTMKEIALDTAAYAKGRVTICEIMGRDAGWLTAAAVVAEPDLIFLPERPFDMTLFTEKVCEIYARKNRCLVAVSEGIKDKNGLYIGAGGAKDNFNHVQLGGVSALLADFVTKKTRIKTRSIEFGLPTRAAGHMQAATDKLDAFVCGEAAANAALNGESGVMTALTDDGCVVCKNLKDIANAVRLVPQEYLTNDGCGISEKFCEYVLPLTQGEAPHEWRNGTPVYFDASKLKKL